jgi:hypothetical protein
MSCSRQKATVLDVRYFITIHLKGIQIHQLPGTFIVVPCIASAEELPCGDEHNTPIQHIGQPWVIDHDQPAQELRSIIKRGLSRLCPLYDKDSCHKEEKCEAEPYAFGFPRFHKHLPPAWCNFIVQQLTVAGDASPYEDHSKVSSILVCSHNSSFHSSTHLYSTLYPHIYFNFARLESMYNEIERSLDESDDQS